MPLRIEFPNKGEKHDLTFFLRKTLQRVTMVRGNNKALMGN